MSRTVELFVTFSAYDTIIFRTFKGPPLLASLESTLATVE